MTKKERKKGGEREKLVNHIVLKKTRLQKQRCRTSAAPIASYVPIVFCLDCLFK